MSWDNPSCPAKHHHGVQTGTPPRLKDIPDRGHVLLVQRLVGRKFHDGLERRARVYERLQRKDSQRLLYLRQHVPALILRKMAFEAATTREM